MTTITMRVRAAAPGEAVTRRWKLMLVALVPSGLTLCTGTGSIRVRVSCCTSYTTAHQPPSAAATPASPLEATPRLTPSVSPVSFIGLPVATLTLFALMLTPVLCSRERCLSHRPSLKTKYRLVVPSHCS